MPCPNCGTDNPEQAKFCFECASPLTTPAAGAGVERKVVSVLFCDLVGFTSRSEAADPEDVLATIRPYHAMLRDQIEAFGGTVEKFIGDAVMAVFGAPVTHEDDPERAVRAGLAILETIEDVNEREDSGLSVRIGIATGEAVVTLDARPERGEGMVAGDVVNTAARIQTGAPPGAVVTGEQTYLATKEVFDYEDLAPIDAKGKAEPVTVWRATGARARFGTDITRTHTSPLVGRDVERDLLAGVMTRSMRDRSCQLVTILGEPGAGKSRMVAELAAWLDEHPELVVWRQGRCLPYGDGITFWALGEIVKAQAGILESDSPETARVKLEDMLRALKGLQDGEYEWLRARLGPLVGAEAVPGAGGGADQQESFAAWQRFLEAVPGPNPAVYVFEDLHWADESLCAFIEHVADWSQGAPILLVGTARPEFFEAHPDWASGLRNATTMHLAPLTEAEVTQLIGELLGQAALPAEIQRPIVERAGGNPFYVEEFIRMLKDRDLLTRRGQAWELAEGAEVPLPESVQGLIAGRLDTLEARGKALLRDAAVIGKVFWSGALVAMGDLDEQAVRRELHELSRKEFVRAARRPSMEGESEYAFLHMLGRDVAYGQIPRAARATKHVAAAGWLEAKAGDRAEDLADVLAHHYAEAARLTAELGEDAAELTEQAVRFLVLAGERALEVDLEGAAAAYEQALELMPPDYPDRPRMLVGLSRVMRSANRLDRARDLAEEAAAGADPLQAAQGKRILAHVLFYAGRSITIDDVLARVDESIEDLEALDPGPELVDAYADRAGWAYVGDRDEEAVAWADKALALAEGLDLPVAPHALNLRSSSRWWLTGDPESIEDLHRGLTLARERGLVRTEAVGHNNLSLILGVSQGPAEALREADAGIELARRGGHWGAMEGAESSRNEHLYPLGRWDEVLAGIEVGEARGDIVAELRISRQTFGCMIGVWRGNLAWAARAADDLAGTVASREPQYAIMGTAALAHLALAQGDPAGAAEGLRGLGSNEEARSSWAYPGWLPELTRTALAVGDPDLAQALTEGLPEQHFELARLALGMTEAQLAEARGEFERAAELYAAAEAGWRTFSVPERAQSLLGRGRCLLELGDPAAATVLQESREVFATLEAKRFLAEADAHLERAIRLTS